MTRTNAAARGRRWRGSLSTDLGPSRRGSVLLVALLLVAIMGVSLATYLTLGQSLLKQAHRTYFADAALNLAEAGAEQATWSFNQVAAGTDTATAWGSVDSVGTAWTCNTSSDTATLAMPATTIDQNATAQVKVYVQGYKGSANSATIVSEATITPVDGSSPIVKILKVTLGYSGKWAYGLVALNDLTWNGHPSADSFLSTTDVATGPYSTYPASVSRSNTKIGSVNGSINLGSGGVVHGDVYLGSGTVSGGTITGATNTGFTYDSSFPTYPTNSSVSQSYSLGSSVPSSLPRSGDSPASDGKYYYFASGATISSLTVAAGNSVVVVGSGNTSVSVRGSSSGDDSSGESDGDHGGSSGGSDDDHGHGSSSCSGITVQSSANLELYLDGPISASGNGVINNSSWAGALQIFTTTTSACSIGGNGTIYACVFCPNAALTCNGGGSSGMLVGSYVAKSITSNGHMDFHYDEALKGEAAGKPWVLSEWRELQSASERSSYAAELAAF